MEPFLERLLRLMFIGRLTVAIAGLIACRTASGVSAQDRNHLSVIAVAMIAYAVVVFFVDKRIGKHTSRILLNAFGDSILVMAFYAGVTSARPAVLLGAMFFAGGYAVLGGFAIALPFSVLITANVALIESGTVRPTPGITSFTIAMFGVLMVLQTAVLDALARQRFAWSEDVEVLTDTVETMAEAALTDSLTGVANRHGMELFLSRIGQRAGDQPVGILLIDVDRLKQVNDDIGHLVGDSVLRVVARCIRHHVRPEDLVSRWGGDEFLAVQPGVDSDIAAGVAARIVKALEDAPILLPSGEMLPVTVSIGVTTAMADGFTEAIEEADTALRAAKQAGRNGVQLARPTNG